MSRKNKFYQKLFDVKEEIKKEAYQEEAKRLIEVFLGYSIKKIRPFKSFHLKTAKLNAIKCCNESIKELTYCVVHISDAVTDRIQLNNELADRIEYYKSIKQQIKKF